MRAYWVITLFLLLALPVHAQDSTEGGNITHGDADVLQSTAYWAAIVGNLNGTPADTTTYISVQDTPNMTVYLNQPNGSYTNLTGFGMVLTRLPYKPNESLVSGPVQSDFNESGMFSNFTVFSGVSYATTVEDPEDTFVGSWTTATCQLGNISVTCPYIVLEPNIAMAVLKFDNGTHVEPLFFGTILNRTGYNGSWFEFEYMVPALETYYFYVYGQNLPPYVDILTPLPVTYAATGVPFTFNITDDIGISSCWYVLDGTPYSMLDCVTPMTLFPSPGVHTLTLYANDTINQTGSDSVIFRVSAAVPPPTPPQGGGGTQTPYYPPPAVPPEVPPPPPGLQFSVSPEDIWVTVNYPDGGSTDFTLTSNMELDDLECVITGDFAEYASVQLDSDFIAANGTVSGTITMSMSPQEILDYNRGMSGYLQCIGRRNPSYSALANIFLIINKPFLEMENQTYTAAPGELFNGTAPIWNMGSGNATAVDIAAVISGLPYAVSIDELPARLEPGEQGFLRFSTRIPDDVEEGVTAIVVDFYENGRLIGKGYIFLNVMAAVPGPPEVVCEVPDLGWTLMLLLLAIISGMIAFRKKLEGERYG